jgi:hypothetical protein
MTDDEIDSLIDQVHAIAMDEADPVRLRSRLGYLLRPALERIEPVSWEVKTKSGEVECRIANWFFKMDLRSQAEADGTIPKDRIERQAQNLRTYLAKLQDGRPLKAE